MTVKHVGETKPPRVRLNRGDPRTPFLSNKVTGTQDQLTPNGCSYNGPWPPLDGVYGATEIPETKPADWGGNQSGE